MLGPFTTASRRLMPIHQMSLAVLSRAACTSMSTTTTTVHDGTAMAPWNGPNYRLQHSHADLKHPSCCAAGVNCWHISVVTVVWILKELF